MTVAKSRWLSYPDALAVVSNGAPEGADPEQIVVHAIRDGYVGFSGESQLIEQSMDDTDFVVRKSLSRPGTPFSVRSRVKNPRYSHIEFDLAWGVSGSDYLIGLSPESPGFWEVITNIQINEKDFRNFLSKKFYFKSIDVPVGRSRKSDGWLKFAITVIAWSKTGKLNQSSFPKYKDFVGAITASISGRDDNSLEERRIRYDTKILYDIFVQTDSPINLHQYFDLDGVEIDADALLFDAISRVVSKKA
ncbi:hypothetical protein [Sphingomonas sp. PB4P5]|uniref:hypothetical protein n=1 Tax=Parasphingomonas puruogangriensis TaxID=3096155 RepID=UPI002FC5F759